MHLFLTILAFLIIFSVLVLVHEAGHFFVAKRHGVKVEEFGFGLPPRIWGKKVGETLYSLNWIPFGGFVRMLGEDARDKKAAKNPRSFMHKSKWQRTQVVCAGVVMNFVLAWVLVSIGFMVGMQPLIVNSEDFGNALREGRVDVVPGVDVEIPRAVVASSYPKSGLLPGDIILTIQGKPVFYSVDIQEMLTTFRGELVPMTVWRDGVVEVMAPLSVPHRTVISKVLPGSPAEAGGLLEGDRVLSVNGEPVFIPEDVVKVLKASDDPNAVYGVERRGAVRSFTIVRNEQGLVGVMLGLLIPEAPAPFSYYDGAQVSSIVGIQPVQYPWYSAPWHALTELKRIGGYTVVMIGNVFGSIFSSGEVPEGVAGPVGIAQMTGVYLQEGFVALMRFTALLSLSLAVINIFPFPALDGGRFLFILIELVRGKPVDSRIEGWIHSFGFLLLLGVIVLVTFKDIVRLVS